MKKGAMFGLDARIALAIFGALSVISGAALYSAIQDAKLVSKYSGFKEIIKANESLYLDTGSLREGSATMYNVEDLLSNNGISGWKGPYLEGTSRVDGSNIFLEGNGNIPDGYSLRIRNMKSSDWHPVTSDWNTEMACSVSTDICNLWVHLANTTGDNSLGEMLDAKFDDATEGTGSIRYGTTGSIGYIFIKGFIINSQ
tara:strand:+ start:222 stop:818 length:597 start_codon:yes stop_codon:yes gene_type:complete